MLLSIISFTKNLELAMHVLEPVETNTVLSLVTLVILAKTKIILFFMPGT